MKKRILSLLLALVLALSLLPVNTFAADDTAAAVSKMTKMSFAGTPAFDADNVYFEQSEGTLFQLDDRGNRRAAQESMPAGPARTTRFMSALTRRALNPPGLRLL